LRGNEYPGEFGDGPREVAQMRLDSKRQTYNKYWARVHSAAGAIEAMKMLQQNGATPTEVLANWQGWGQESSEHMHMMKGQVIEAKYWLTRAGGFDRHASVMPLQHVPKGTFPPEIEERLSEAIIEGEVPVG
jgi:hypothetical protein